MNRMIGAIVGLLVVVTSTSVVECAPMYRITDLGSLRMYIDTIRDINNQNVAVGTSTYSFVWKNGIRTSLKGRYYEGYSFACHINEAGNVAGFTDMGAAVWDAGSIRYLGSLPAYYDSRAYCNNNVGQVVGVSGDATQMAWTGHACLWQNGNIIDLNSYLGMTWSCAQSINDAGQVVGEFGGMAYEGGHAFLMTGGSVVDLGVLPGKDYSVAHSINDFGEIAGYAFDGSLGGRAFLWRNGTMTDLGVLPGRYTSYAYDINRSGQIVGSSSERACMWDEGEIIDLNNAIPSGTGWTLRYAQAINDNGCIVGWGTSGGAAHGFLLTPVPEPASITSMAVSIMLFCGACVSRKR